MIKLPIGLESHRIRVGCDVMAIDEIRDSVSEFGDRYLRKVFTTHEIEDCEGPTRLPRLAARFAAKEAVIKAFSQPDMSFPLNEIEVAKDDVLPVIRLTGSVAEQARQQGWIKTSLSLSHADCHAMAVVVVICDPTDGTDSPPTAGGLPR